LEEDVIFEVSVGPSVQPQWCAAASGWFKMSARFWQSFCFPLPLRTHFEFLARSEYGLDGASNGRQDTTGVLSH